MTTLETIEKLTRYSATLPGLDVRYDLAYLLGGITDQYDVHVAPQNISNFYGSPDKAPLWLQSISNAQPGHYESALAEARAHLAAELDAFEVNYDDPDVAPF